MVLPRHMQNSVVYILTHIRRKIQFLVELYPLHKTIDHLLLPGLFEGDGELVAVDLHHLAVAEFLVKHAVVEGKFRNRAGGFRDQLALDGYGCALVAREAAGAAARRSIAAR